MSDKSKPTKLEQAKEFERKAKQLRREIKDEEKQNRIKLQAKFGEIISEVIGREIEEKDIDYFRKYALGIGSQYIIRALNSSSQ